MITYFVIAAVRPNVNVIEVFAAQAFVTLGYNSIPLPGGVGAFELLYLNTYRAMGFENHFVLVAVMITRLISYYACMLLSGGYTLTYHLLGGKKKKAAQPAIVEGEIASTLASETPEQRTNEEETETTPQQEKQNLEEENNESDQ